MIKKIIIEGQETNYTISDKGEIYNTSTKKYLKGTIRRNEYRSVQLTINGKARSFMVHRLVAENFLPNPDNLPIVHHINGDKYDNRLENLQWVTNRENSLHTFGKLDNPVTDFDKDVPWLPLKGFEQDYLISENGFLKRIKNEQILFGSLRNGYRRFQLKRKYYSAHRLVYETFVGPIPEGMIIDHINGIKDDNRLENLRCITQSENAINAQKNGHKGQHKVAQYDLNNNLIKEYPSFTAAAKEFNVSYSAISSAAKRNGTSCGYRWKEL